MPAVHLERRRTGLAALTEGQNVAQALFNVADLQGLGQKFPGPGTQGGFRRVAVAVSGDDDDIRLIGEMGEFALKFKAVAVRQPSVQQHHVHALTA